MSYLGFDLDDIRAHHEQGLLSVHALDDLIIANYTAKCTYGERWDPVTLQCRGLVLRLDKPWPEGTRIEEVVALPLKKFFNWGEGGRAPASWARVSEVAEKLDGSYGVLFRHNGGHRIATRGSFDSEQARWATRKLREHDLSRLPYEATLLFEIVYPGNRVVVDYGEREELVLLGIRNRWTGGEMSSFLVDVMARRFGFARPTTYHGGSVDDIDELLAWAERLDLSMEGWVLRFSDGSRFKIKGQEYLRVHRLLSDLSKRRVVEALMEGRLEEWAEAIPEEFRAQVDGWRQEVEEELAAAESEVEAWLSRAPATGRKDFALWVQRECPEELVPLVFNRSNGYDIRPALLKKMLKKCG